MLNYGKGNQVPVHKKLGFCVTGPSGELNLREFTRIDWLAIYREFFFEYAQFSESLWQLERNRVCVELLTQLYFNFEPHRRVRRSARKISGTNECSHAVGAASNLLKDFQRQSDACFASPVTSDQKNRRSTSYGELEIF